MYLTSFRFNPVRRGAQRLLTSPHALHAAVLAGFPDPSPTDRGRVLWRLDTARHDARLYIVSPERPDLTHLAEQAGWPALDETWRTRDYRPLLDRIEHGQRYAFRLTANPVHSVREQEGTRGKPRGHVTAEQQERWLLDRQERAGFSVDESLDGAHSLVVRDRKTLAFRRREIEVVLRVATYEGNLTVAEPAAFVAALCFGIGRARGYGCGLLTIAPVR